MNKEAIQELARKFFTRRDLGVPINLEMAAEIAQAIVMCRKLPESISGIVIPPAGDRAHYLIGINPQQSLQRQRFTIAHEIAHIVLGHPKKAVSLIVFTEKSTNQLDRAADVFAAELLMPYIHVRDLFFKKGWRNLEDFAKFYMVSRVAMEIRLKELGLLGKIQRRS
jgi:Zn-dependent peptidase ImmA (M78 family)